MEACEIGLCARLFFMRAISGTNPSESLEPAARAKVVRTLELLRMQHIVSAKFWKKLSG
jgi:hypothetical protein